MNMKLKADRRDFYLVKEGDTLQSICEAAEVSPVALCKLNGIPIKNGIKIGMILGMPPYGNRYTVQTGDDIVTLCGSLERFEQLNGTKVIFPSMKIRI